MITYQCVLRKVGWSLVVIGIVDISFMIYCLSNKISYSSSFNIFAVIGGIFLIKGSAKATLTISFFSAFFSSGFLSLIAILFFIMPMDLILTYFNLHPVQAMGWTAFFIALVAYLLWIYKNLTSDSVINFIDATGTNRKALLKNPRNGFIAGCLLILVLSLSLFLSIDDHDMEKAKAEARSKVGENYKLAITSFNKHSSYGNKTQYNFTVTAYNENEIRPIEVEWEE